MYAKLFSVNNINSNKLAKGWSLLLFTQFNQSLNLTITLFIYNSEKTIFPSLDHLSTFGFPNVSISFRIQYDLIMSQHELLPLNNQWLWHELNQQHNGISRSLWRFSFCKIKGQNLFLVKVKSTTNDKWSHVTFPTEQMKMRKIICHIIFVLQVRLSNATLASLVAKRSTKYFYVVWKGT